MDNEDFYITIVGYKYFTEKYHVKRGYCCKSNCNIVLTGLTQILIK